MKFSVGIFLIHLLHCWNKCDNCIEFQQRPTVRWHSNYSAHADIDFRMDLNTRHMVHVKNDREMLEVRGDSFREITNYFIVEFN